MLNYQQSVKPFKNRNDRPQANDLPHSSTIRNLVSKPNYG